MSAEATPHDCDGWDSCPNPAHKAGEGVGLSEDEGLAYDLTHATLAHYGYLPDEIARAESVHPGRVCDDDECWDEDGRSIHGRVHTELHRTAAVVVDVVLPIVAARVQQAEAERDALRERVEALVRAAEYRTASSLNRDFTGRPFESPVPVADLRAALDGPR